MRNNYVAMYSSDIGRPNLIQAIQHEIIVPNNWRYGQATQSLVCFDSVNTPYSIRVRSDHHIDVDGYGRSKRYHYKDTADAVRIINACFKVYQ